jgi:hypothetical protein
MKMKIGIQGAVGSFSEEASNKFMKDHGLEDVTIEYLISSKRSSAERRKS